MRYYKANPSTVVQNAKLLAGGCHAGVLRKDFDNVPYTRHTDNVSKTLQHYFPDDFYLQAAGHAHDILEDCHDIEWEDVREVIGDEAFSIVKEVTNPSKKFPELSRKERKKMDREHIKTISYKAKCLKLADRTDNLLDACQSPRRDWVRMYVEESMFLYTALVGTHFALEVRFLEALAAAGRVLTIPINHYNSFNTL